MAGEQDVSGWQSNQETRVLLIRPWSLSQCQLSAISSRSVPVLQSDETARCAWAGNWHASHEDLSQKPGWSTESSQSPARRRTECTRCNRVFSLWLVRVLLNVSAPTRNVLEHPFWFPVPQCWCKTTGQELEFAMPSLKKEKRMYCNDIVYNIL